MVDGTFGRHTLCNGGGGAITARPIAAAHAARPADPMEPLHTTTHANGIPKRPSLGDPG